MSRVGAIAILICAAMILGGAAPILAYSQLVVRGDHGPNASAISWEFTAIDHGTWSMDITNHGLHSLEIVVYDNTTGVPQEISYQKLRFSLYKAYPTGFTISSEVMMEANRVYSITVTPHGKRGTYCEIQDFFWPTYPVAILQACWWKGLNVSFDGSDSYHVEGGSIVDYEWSFGDGAHASGAIVYHTYAAAGIYHVILTVTDNIGLTDQDQGWLHLVDAAPIASFEYSLEGPTVTVDASESHDDVGIISYEWDWGDGTTGTGLTASHTYEIPAAAGTGAVLQAESTGKGVPFPVAGQTTDIYGNILGNCYVEITNLRTGAYLTAVSDPLYGVYQSSLMNFPGGWSVGDVIRVTASTPGWYGENQTTINEWDWYLSIDVTLYEAPSPPLFTITLKVIDTVGQVSTLSRTIGVGPGPAVVAQFWYSTYYKVAWFDASVSFGQTGIADYAWDWGDMSQLEVTTSPTISHTYAAYGTYQVTLTVTDASGRTDSTSETVYVQYLGPP